MTLVPGSNRNITAFNVPKCRLTLIGVSVKTSAQTRLRNTRKGLRFGHGVHGFRSIRLRFQSGGEDEGVGWAKVGITQPITVLRTLRFCIVSKQSLLVRSYTRENGSAFLFDDGSSAPLPLLSILQKRMCLRPKQRLRVATSCLRAYPFEAWRVPAQLLIPILPFSRRNTWMRI